MKNQLRATYDKNGLGITELMLLGLHHPSIYGIVTCLINWNMAKLGLKLARLIV